MARKTLHPATDVIGAPAELPLWAESYTPETRARDIARLVPLAQEIAEKSRDFGYTVSDIRITAVQRGLLTGEEKGRRLSFLHAVPKAAGHTQTGQYRRSDVQKAHGNLNAVWCDRRYAQRAG
jgi:hypothetical protein